MSESTEQGELRFFATDEAWTAWVWNNDYRDVHGNYPRLDELCTSCGKRAGAHRSEMGWCPTGEMYKYQTQQFTHPTFGEGELVSE